MKMIGQHPEADSSRRMIEVDESEGSAKPVAVRKEGAGQPQKMKLDPYAVDDGSEGPPNSAQTASNLRSLEVGLSRGQGENVWQPEDLSPHSNLSQSQRSNQSQPQRLNQSQPPADSQREAGNRPQA